MNCPTCGASVVEEAAFCHQCGQRLDQAAAGDPFDDSPSEPTSSYEQARSPADRLRPSRTDSTGDREDVEVKLWQGTYCPETMVGPFSLAIAVLVVSVVVGMMVNRPTLTWVLVVANPLLWLGIYLRYLYQRIKVRYELTTQRFVHELGVLRRVTDRIEVIDIDDITVEQGPIERMLGIGTIRITSSDRTHPEIRLPGIANVRRVAAMMDDARRDERRRRGLYVEAV